MNRFRYPALYVRMAFYIGAALTAFVLIGALVFASVASWELTGYLEARNSEIGDEAARILNTEGREGLRQWLRTEATIPDDATLYIMDSAGDDILGRPVPGAYKDFVVASAEAAHQHEDNFRPVRVTPELVAPDGTVYSFLVVPSNITLFGSIATALGLIAVALLVIASIAWLIAGRIGRPIGELQQAVRNLAAGDINARVPESIARRNDELGQLADDFTDMAEHLNTLIQGRERLMRELSHELRSPLTRLQAALALAAARNRLNEDEQRRVDHEITQMNKVIGEILRYSALDSSARMNIRLVRVDRLLRELIDLEELEAQSAKCTLHMKAERNLEVVCDKDMLNSAFENILRNAIRYAPAGSTVEVDACREESGDAEGRHADIRVTFSDSGPGVPSEQLQRIFEPYVRVGNDSNGTGLGLAIVKRVVERHGGRVHADRSEGGGLSVTVWIPAADFA